MHVYHTRGSPNAAPEPVRDPRAWRARVAGTDVRRRPDTGLRPGPNPSGAPDRREVPHVLDVLAALRDGLVTADDVVPNVDPRVRDLVLRQLGRLEASVA